MKERVGQTLAQRGAGPDDFHLPYLGLDIIKREYAAPGMKSNFSLFDDTDRVALLKELTEGLIDDDKVVLQQPISTISNWKTICKPRRRPRQAQGVNGSGSCPLLRAWRWPYEGLQRAGILTIRSLLPTLLLQRNEEVRERWQNKIRYLLVDEYQDTNNSQYEMVKLLVGQRARFTVVGDDDQSIYSGAGPGRRILVLLSSDSRRRR